MPSQTETNNRIIDAFADKMKAKMAEAELKGKGGWDDPNLCSTDILLPLFHEHVNKGDPVDVAIFAMMLDHYGATTNKLIFPDYSIDSDILKNAKVPDELTRKEFRQLLDVQFSSQLSESIEKDSNYGR